MEKRSLLLKALKSIANRAIEYINRIKDNLWSEHKLLSSVPEEIRAAEPPLFYHCPSGSIWNGISETTFWQFQWHTKKILREGRVAFDHKSCKLPNILEKVHFITYSTYASKTLIEKSYDTYSIPVTVLGKDIQDWDWLAKITLVLDFVRTQPKLKKYLLVTDARDVVLTTCPHSLIDKFSTYNASVIFCNTVADWPPCKKLYNFESRCYIEYPLHAHLSAGGYFGFTEKIVKYLEKIEYSFKNRLDWCFYRSNFDDQLAWRFLHKEYFPDIKVDFKSLIFRRFDSFRYLDY